MDTTLVLEQNALALVESAKAITITSPESYTSAWDFLKKLKAMQKAWEEHHAPTVTATNTAHKMAVAARDKLLTPFGVAERWVKGLIGTYDREQERLRAEAERAAQLAAQKAQEDAQLAAAVEAEQAGQREEAEAILEAPVVVPPVIFRPTTPKVAGGSIRENWKARCTDLKALIKAVAEGRAPSTLLLLNQSALDQLAKAAKQDFQVPGCQAYTESVVSARA